MESMSPASSSPPPTSTLLTRHPRLILLEERQFLRVMERRNYAEFNSNKQKILSLPSLTGAFLLVVFLEVERIEGGAVAALAALLFV